MAFLDKLKSIFTSKENVDKVTNVASDAVAKASDFLADKLAFDDINLSKLNDLVVKFNLESKLNDLAPEISAKLKDGTLTEEEVKAFIPKLKSMLQGGIASASTAYTENVVEAKCANGTCDANNCKCANSEGKCANGTCDANDCKCEEGKCCKEAGCDGDCSDCKCEGCDCTDAKDETPNTTNKVCPNGTCGEDGCNCE